MNTATIQNEAVDPVSGSTLEQNTPVLSFGGKSVGLSFNPGGSESVRRIKESCAEAIDVLNDLRETCIQVGDIESTDIYSAAIEEIKSASIRGVKAALLQP